MLVDAQLAYFWFSLSSLAIISTPSFTLYGNHLQFPTLLAVIRQQFPVHLVRACVKKGKVVPKTFMVVKIMAGIQTVEPCHERYS
jgi:hypothetical protein